jgi:hypothetical protein
MRRQRMNYDKLFDNHISSKSRILFELNRTEKSIANLDLAIEDMNHFLWEAKLGRRRDDVEWSKQQLADYKEEHQEEIAHQQVLNKQLDSWFHEYRNIHLNMIWDLEKEGVPIHTVSLDFGPTHPVSYLLYKDGNKLVFQRDGANKYTSYAFWLQFVHLKEPIEVLGTDYFSARELGVTPSVIDTLYTLENKYIGGDFSVMDEIIRIRSELESKI